MEFPYYTAQPLKKARTPHDLPRPPRLDQDSPQGYEPDPGLVNAVNVALIIGQPLLVTGEVGTGKTQLASSVAWQFGDESLGNDKPIKFETKSTSKANDLFYTYDTLRRFRATQDSTMSQKNKSYITYNALGQAILLTRKRSEVDDWLPDGFVHTGPHQSVVLIDEIDKAPRDFPNDILNEIDNMYFRVPEINNAKVEAEPDLWPIVILTSNSEKNLPDAFLRRCVYYHIPFPDEQQMATIVKKRIREYKKQPSSPAPGDVSVGDDNTALLSDALNFFFSLRIQETQLYKKPGTAELLGWLTVMLRLGADVNEKLAQKVKDASGQMSNIARLSLSALVKNSDDQKLADYYLDDYLQQNPA